MRCGVRGLIAGIDALGAHGAVALLLLAPGSRSSLQDTALGLGRALVRRSPGAVMLVRFAEGAPTPADVGRIEIRMIDGMATGVIGLDARSTHRMNARLVAGLKALYPYVIITAPPTTASFESIELALSADLIVPVIEAEVTRRPVVRNMLLQVGDIGRVLGAVLVGRRPHVPDWLYRLVIDRRPAVS